MPDMIIMDGNFYPMLPVVDAYSSLQWTRRYYECGEFELHAPVEFCDLLKNGQYVYRNDAIETGLIEEFGYSLKDGGEENVFVKGRFLNTLLDSRVIENTKNVSGNAETVMRQLVDCYAIHPQDTSRVIEKLVLGNLNGVGASISGQVLGDSLKEYFDSICLEQDISYRIGYDPVLDKLFFSVWQGLDRSDGQTENNLAVFSRDFENICSESYVHNIEKSKNFAYVAGGEDDNPVMVTVSTQNPGEARREAYINAGSIKQKDDNGNPISDTQYRALLRQYGLEKLSEMQIAENVDTVIHPYGNLEYKKDFDLGDLCIVQNARIGYQTKQRITEVREIFENGCTQIEAVFGTEKMTIKKYIDRRLKNG